MQGLSQGANNIIEPFSKLEFLKDYQLIGGTALAIKLNHRLSEDLDFCQWVPDTDNPKYAVDAKAIHEKLIGLFSKVDDNHLGFSQVNYYVHDPGVKLTFYHTALNKPKEPAIPLLGNIMVADTKVLAGSKMYVTLKRIEVRDYYDIYILLEHKHSSLKEMLLQANALSREVTAKKVSRIFESLKFTESEMSDFEILEPKFPITAFDLNSYFKSLAEQIKNL